MFHYKWRTLISFAFTILCISSQAQTLIINEVDADTEGTDDKEFVELYDGGVGNTPLDGLVLVFFNGSDDASYQSFDLDGQSTDINGYFVVGNAAVANVDLVFNNNTLQNGPDAVALFTGNSSDFPEDTPVTAANLLDAFVYDTNDSDDNSLISVLTPGQNQINEDGNGDKDGDSNQRCPNGSGSALMTNTYNQFTPTPGTENTCGAISSIIFINEVDADNLGSDMLEFVELYDGGVGNTLLDGLVLVFINGSDDASYQSFDLDGQTTNSNGYFVIGNAAVANVDMIFSNNTLQNGADAVALYFGNASDFPNDTPVSSSNLLDALVYDTDDSDDATLLSVLTPGQAQINERDGGDGQAHSNQRCPNGSGDPLMSDTYAQFIPTPGTENLCGVEPQIVPTMGQWGIIILSLLLMVFAKLGINATDKVSLKKISANSSI